MSRLQLLEMVYLLSVRLFWYVFVYLFFRTPPTPTPRTLRISKQRFSPPCPARTITLLSGNLGVVSERLRILLSDLPSIIVLKQTLKSLFFLL